MWPVLAELDLAGRALRFTGFGLFAGLGMLLATLLCVLRARRFGFERFDALAASALAFAFGIVGAKALFLVVSFEQVRERGVLPFLSEGGLVWFGGVLGGMVAVLVFLRSYRLDALRFADLAAPAVALGHAVGRLGCFAAGCCWGRPTSQPWGVRFPASPFFEGPSGIPLHPVQVYEAAGELVLAAVAWALGGRAKKGSAFAAWLVGYGLLRLAMELLFRGDDRGAGVLGLPPSVGLSLAAMGAGAFLLLRRERGLTTEKIVT